MSGLGRCHFPETRTDMTMTEAPSILDSGVLEKTALETYVPPAKPSLVGLSRAELSDRLGGIGVPEKQRKMRSNQLFHWIYHKGVTSFGVMSNIEGWAHYTEQMMIDEGYGDDAIRLAQRSDAILRAARDRNSSHIRWRRSTRCLRCGTIGLKKDRKSVV